jgi:hypothetical protein
LRPLQDKTLPPHKHQTYNKELPLASARVQTQVSNKHNLVLYVDQELVEESRELGFNLSKTFENHLEHLLIQFSHVNSSNNIGARFIMGPKLLAASSNTYHLLSPNELSPLL